MLKRKTFLKKKASRDISASRNLRLRRLKHRKAKQFQRHALQLSDSRYLKKGRTSCSPFSLFTHSSLFFKRIFQTFFCSTRFAFMLKFI